MCYIQTPELQLKSSSLLLLWLLCILLAKYKTNSNLMLQTGFNVTGNISFLHYYYLSVFSGDKQSVIVRFIHCTNYIVPLGFYRVYMLHVHTVYPCIRGE